MKDAIIKIPYFLKRLYHKVISSIAFYPILISIIFVALATALPLVDLEKYEFLSNIKLPYITITDSEIAQTILSTIIGGILSLTVFSFSMVMVVLSQASSNFSPRLLPGLISDKKHQAILGIYTGTLLYAFIVLINLGALAEKSEDLGLATMLAAVFGVCCVVLFVYFIHSISQSIQIDNIIQRICLNTNKKLEVLLRKQEHADYADDYLEMVNADFSGYVIDFGTNFSERFTPYEGLQIHIVTYLGEHLWKGKPLFHINKDLPKELKDEIKNNFEVSQSRNDSKEYLGGMTRLMEVAVKALSPGINDPGTAVDAIIKLNRLMRKALKLPSNFALPSPNKKIALSQSNIGPVDLMRIIIEPIRHYGQDDFSVLCALTESLNSIKEDEKIVSASLEAINHQLDLLREQFIVNDHHKKNELYFNKLF